MFPVSSFGPYGWRAALIAALTARVSKNAVRTDHVSISPIQVDLTRYSALEQVAAWLERP